MEEKIAQNEIEQNISLEGNKKMEISIMMSHLVYRS